MKIIVRLRQTTRDTENYETVFEFKKELLQEGETINVDVEKGNSEKLKGFLGETTNLTEKENVNFGFKILKRRPFSIKLEVFGDGLFNTKKNKLTPDIITLHSFNEKIFERTILGNRMIYFISYVNDGLQYNNVKNATPEDKKQYKEMVEAGIFKEYEEWLAKSPLNSLRKPPKKIMKRQNEAIYNFLNRNNKTKLVISTNPWWSGETAEASGQETVKKEYLFILLHKNQVIENGNFAIKILNKKDDCIKLKILTNSLRVFEPNKQDWEMSPRKVKLTKDSAICCETISKDGGMGYSIALSSTIKK